MKKPKRIGTYEHFCVLITSQGKWKESDLQEIRQALINERTKHRTDDYPLIMKFVHRTEKPSYSDCKLCDPLYDLLVNVKGNYQAIIYQGHHYLDPEDSTDMIDIVKLLMENSKVKKIFILYLDSLSEFKREVINRMTYDELQGIIALKKLSKSEFLNILLTKQFQNRTCYEILKDAY